MTKAPGCKARQVSDQMSCADCTLTWDMNDPDPPMCGRKIVGNQGLAQIREVCSDKSRETTAALLFLKEMPFNALPTFGLQPGLRQVNWFHYPALRYCAITRPSGNASPSTRFMFYGEMGEPLIEVFRMDDFAAGVSGVRHYHDGKPGEWRA